MTKERQVAHLPLEVAQVATKGRTLAGYASAFNYPIDSGTRHHPETTLVRPGAFTKTLNEHADRVQVLVNHGMDARWGMSPVATVTDMHQDQTGLRVSAEIIDDPSFDPLVASLKAGAFRAMSIQFEPIKQSHNDDRTERYLEEVSLWEFGPVTFPANEAAVAELNSLTKFAADLAASQAESLEDESRQRTLEASRLTWVSNASRKLELEDEELQAMAARMARLKG